VIYGYARVSPGGQSLDAQAKQLRAARAAKVFREMVSGAKTDRAQLRRALNQLAAGDVLLVTRLDRLARSTRDLLNTLAAIAEKGARFRSLGDTWADTTTAHGRLILTVLGGLAEFERELIRARTGEGRARAVANGVKMGRKPKLTPHQKKAYPPPRRGRGVACRYRTQLQRVRMDDFAAGVGHAMSAPDHDPGPDSQAQLFSEGWLFAALIDMVDAHCATPESDRVKSFGWRSNARAMRLLAQAGYIEIESEDDDQIEARILPKARELMRLVAAAEKTA
jgi:DNA invertase Pin-like site-specific DNA recombinase